MKADDKLLDQGLVWLNGERPTNKDAARLWDIANKGMQRARQRTQELEVKAEVEPGRAGNAVVSEALNEENKSQATSHSLSVQRSLPLEARLRTAAKDLQQFDAVGAFDSFPLTPQNEFPTSLTRLPIFRPSQRRKQQSIQDIDNAVNFDTPFGTGRRLGPPLTIRDEDTLIALMRLRDRALAGPESHLPRQCPRHLRVKNRKNRSTPSCLYHRSN